MELEASTQEPANSPSISESNPDEKEISDDDDDDRNHKHRRRDDARSQSQEREAIEHVYTKPYRRGNKPFENGHTYRESGLQSNHMDFKFDKRRPLDLNPRIRGRGRGRDPGVWNQRDIASQMGPGLFGGRGLPTVSNAYGTSWGAFGLVPGLPNGGMDPLHPLGLQGAYRSINPSMSMGLGLKRQRCRDFEEQGFCLRGDMCPMEHGVNRIVVEDVQSLSQFNLPVSLQNANIPVAPGGPVNSFKPSHGKTNIRGVGPNAGLKDTFIDPAGGVGADFYDPDQPLWGNDSQSSPALQPINQSKGSSVDHRVGPLDVSDERVAKSGGTATGRVNSIKNKTESREDMVTKTSSVEKQGQLSNKRNDANSSLKTHQKAQRTLFVNGIPLHQNKRETLLSHFHKFGEVIDIHIPSNGERAFVQFSRREEAEAALKAPDAVMGNRFIKLFWANRDNIPINGVPPVPPRGMPVSSASRNDTIAPGSDHPKPVINTPKLPPPSQKKLENLEVLKEELRKKQEMLDQKRNDFRRKLAKLEKQTTTVKGEIEPKQVAKKPKLGIVADSAKTETVLSSAGAESVGNGNISLESSGPQRLKSTATVAQQESPVLKPSLRPLPPVGPSVVNISLESSGPQRLKSTATVAQQESPVLKPSLRPLPPVGPSVVINRFKLDNRPTAFKIASTLPNDLANVAVLKEHFSQFGDLSKVEIDDPEPANSNNDPGTGKYSARVYFRTRHSAEKAFSSGKCWNGHNLEFSWLKSSNPSKESERHVSASKGNSDAYVGSENIEQKDISKEQVGPGESNNTS